MLDFFFGKHYALSNRDAFKIILQSILLTAFLAYAFGPFEWSIWGCMAKLATFTGAM